MQRRTLLWRLLWIAHPSLRLVLEQTVTKLSDPKPLPEAEKATAEFVDERNVSTDITREAITRKLQKLRPTLWQRIKSFLTLG